MVNYFLILNGAIIFQLANSENIRYLDTFASETALKFSEKWLAVPTVNIQLMLPNKRPFEIKDVVKLTKKMSKISRKNAYFMTIINITNYDKIKPSQNELWWFPFEAGYYDIGCRLWNNLHISTKKHAHFMLFLKSQKDVDLYFKSCRIRFDSNIVVYYQYNKTDSLPVILFEEIYKIEEHQTKLKRNFLGKINVTSSEFDTSEVESYVWKRRRNLEGTIFTGVTENLAPFIEKTVMSTDIDRNTVVHPQGYFADIMNYLMLTLNFTIKSTLPNKRSNWTYLTDTVGKGIYDIGFTGHMHTRSRSDIVDFSFGVMPYQIELYYVKHSKNFRFDAFIRSFHTDTWYYLAIYVITLIAGCMIAAIILSPHAKRSISKEVVSILEKSINFVLRSVIGKRIATEPTSYSARIAFAIIVFSGFVIITVYRSILVAFVAVELDHPPVKSLNELRNSKYLVAVHKDSAIDAIFQNARPEFEEYKLQKEKKIIRFSMDPNIFVERMVNEKQDTYNTILYYINVISRFNKHYPCTLKHIKNWNQNNRETLGMTFKKNWQFTRFINYHILVMKEIGMLDRLFEPYLRTTKTTCQDEQIIRPIVKIPNPVGIDTTFSLYLLVLVGSVCAMMSLLIEIVYIKYH